MKLGIGLSLANHKFIGGIVSKAFIIEVKTDESGTSNDNQFEFTGGQGNYDVVAKQNNIIVQTFSDLSDDATITFANGAGTYVLEVTPKEASPFNRIRFRFNESNDSDKFLDIKQFGTTLWTSMEEAFSDCTNLVGTYTDVPNLINVTDMRRMFRGANFNNIVTGWNVSNVTDFTETFIFCNNFNQDLSSWDTSKGINFGNFLRGTSFNQPLVNAVTSNATEIDGMLRDTPFDQDISSWDVSNVIDFSGFLEGGELSPTNYDLLLNSWAYQNVKPNQSFHAGTSKFTSAGQVARDRFIQFHNWSIIDGGLI
jgi:hypothetical protein